MNPATATPVALTPEIIIKKNLEHFNQHARTYDKGCVAAHWTGPQTLTQRLNFYIDLTQPGLNGLDITTGTGAQAFEIKRLNPDAYIVGHDGAEEMLNVALEKGAINEAIHLTLQDFSKIVLPKRAFNIVTFTGGADFTEDLDPVIETVTPSARPGAIFGMTYEPVGNPFPGAKNNFRHDPERLHETFRRNGWKVYEDQSLTLWQKGKEGGPRTPVSNNILIATYDAA
jgi:predicted TPR repeat methyltransferase